MRDKENLHNWTQAWLEKRRSSFFDGKFCIICGSKEKLEIHHRDPKLKVSHSVWSWAESKRFAEQVFKI
jgi:hypothetical protein